MLSPEIISRLKEIVGRERWFEGEVDAGQAFGRTAGGILRSSELLCGEGGGKVSVSCNSQKSWTDGWLKYLEFKEGTRSKCFLYL